MTRDAYFEMCETLGSEPIDEEIPVEYEDLHPDIQYAFYIYSKLRDDWDSIGGNYLGKQFAGVQELFNILEVPKTDQKSLLEFLDMIDKHRAKAIAANKPKDTKK